jgi:hypothetical protein
LARCPRIASIKGDSGTEHVSAGNDVTHVIWINGERDDPAATAWFTERFPVQGWGLGRMSRTQEERGANGKQLQDRMEVHRKDN